MGDRLANEIQRCQMSLNEGDPAPPQQSNTFQLLSTSANSETGSIRQLQIPWTYYNGVNILPKFLVKQLRHWVFFGAICLLHLGTQRKLHTKHWFVLSLSMQLDPIWHPYNETETKKVEKVQKTAARWTCRRWRNRRSVDDMLDELEWPSLEDRMVKSSLTFFYKIHSGTVSLDLTPAPNFQLSEKMA